MRFEVPVEGVSQPAFAVRFRGALHGYLNRCRHEARTLDFGDAHFLDESYDALVCVHHGARYLPGTGACLDGPCEGRALTRLRLEEREGALWCTGLERAGAPA